MKKGGIMNGREREGLGRHVVRKGTVGRKGERSE